MASEINELAFDTIIKREQSKKDFANKVCGEFKEAVVETYQKNPFTLDKLKNEIKANPEMKTKYLYGKKNDSYRTHPAIGYGKWNQQHSDIYFTNGIDDDTKDRMNREGCLAVQRFFEKANKENKWKFKTHNFCYDENPRFWISW